jgi:hypothetical protein
MPLQPEERDEEVLAELRALRDEVKGLKSQLGTHRMRPSRDPERKGLKLVVHSLETDPDVQYKIHRWGAIYWILNFPVIIYLFFFHQDLWVRVGVFITLIYSIYANLATDYGAMSSAMAAKGMQPPPEIPLEETG